MGFFGSRQERLAQLHGFVICLVTGLGRHLNAVIEFAAKERVECAVIVFEASLLEIVEFARCFEDRGALVVNLHDQGLERAFSSILALLLVELFFEPVVLRLDFRLTEEALEVKDIAQVAVCASKDIVSRQLKWALQIVLAQPPELLPQLAVAIIGR